MLDIDGFGQSRSVASWGWDADWRLLVEDQQ